MPLRNLKALRDNMKTNEIAVSVIRFQYKHVHYFLAVCLLTEEERNDEKHRYDLVRLCFMNKDDLNHYLDCYANSNSITAGITELRNFLGVEFQPNGFTWERSFLSHLGKQIPDMAPAITSQTKPAVLSTICRNEGRDTNKIYRWSLIRHRKDTTGRQKHRTEYNGQLASLTFPLLYPRFRLDRTVSFGFTNDKNKEKTEEEILSNFEARERLR